MKNFTDFFIQRPVFALVVNLFILLVGFISYNNLPVRQYPRMDASTITINTTYPGANAKTMEGFISTPIENAIGGVDGLDYVVSANTFGSSLITAYFKLGYPISDAVNDINSQVDSVRKILPTGINDPVIQKQDPSAQPTMFISFDSFSKTPEEMTDFLNRVVNIQLETVDGVGQVVIYGGHNYAMRIWMDPYKMAGLNVSPADVQNAIQNGNLQTAAGRTDSLLQELNLLASTDVNTADEFSNLVIADRQGQLIRIKDIGKVELSSQEVRSSVLINDEPSVIVAIIPKSTANPLDVSIGVHKAFDQIQKNLPPEIHAGIRWDTSLFIKASLIDVRNTIIEAIAFVVLVIFLFLGSFRAVLIPMVTIPLSLMGACTLMYALNYTINTLTLLAFVLAIGLVVDDAIVVLENIHRHIEEGLTPVKAALKGAREIGFAIIAMTFTLASVYAPLGFTDGLTGALFREFAFTLAGSVVVSGVVALTLSPMMCSRILTSHNPKLAEKIDVVLNNFQLRYRHQLEKIMTVKKSLWIAALALSIYVFGFIFQTFLRDELAPDEDQGAILTLITAPVSASLQYTQKYTQKLSTIFKSIPEQIGYGLVNGFGGKVNSGFSFLVLKDWADRKRGTSEIIGELFGKYSALTGVNAFPTNIPPLPSTGYFPVGFVIKTMGSYEDLNNAVAVVLKELHQDSRLINVDVDLKYSQPQMNIDIDRDRAASLGVNIGDLSNSLNVALGQPITTYFQINGLSYQVLPQVLDKFRISPGQLIDFPVRSTNGQLIPLSNFISLSQIIAPDSYNHFQQMRAATITASLIPGYALGDALKNIEKIVNNKLSKTFQYDYSGISRQYMQASGTLEFALVFALIFIFLVLSAQFESFARPLIVLTSVPLSLAGALLTLFLVHGSLNIYTKIGLVTLVGLISKHGILLVDFSHRLQTEGLELKEAILKAATLRLRPILMTTSAMVLGSMPLALGTGAGGEARRQIGWVIAGGMSFGTLLTLFVVPCMYFLMYSFLNRNKMKSVPNLSSK